MLGFLFHLNFKCDQGYICVVYGVFVDSGKKMLHDCEIMCFVDI
jgi:hypothetical protein